MKWIEKSSHKSAHNQLSTASPQLWGSYGKLKKNWFAWRVVWSSLKAKVFIAERFKYGDVGSHSQTVSPGRHSSVARLCTHEKWRKWLIEELKQRAWERSSNLLSYCLTSKHPTSREAIVLFGLLVLDFQTLSDAWLCVKHFGWSILKALSENTRLLQDTKHKHYHNSLSLRGSR